MSLAPATNWPKYHLSLNALKPVQHIHPQYSSFPCQITFSTAKCFQSNHPISLSASHDGIGRSLHCTAARSDSGAGSNFETDPGSKSKRQRKGRPKKAMGSEIELDKSSEIPPTIPRKSRRGRRSEAVAVEDFVRDSLEKTFASIREQNPDLFENKEQILKEGNDKTVFDVSDDDGDDSQRDKQNMVVDEDDPNWPVDADVGFFFVETTTNTFRTSIEGLHLNIVTPVLMKQ